MPYTYDEIFAKDTGNPEMIAQDATITIFDPADPTKAPVPIFDVTGVPLPNPITVSPEGMGPAFYSETLDRVGWFGAGFQNYLTSYEGMRAEAQAAKTAAQSAASEAASAVMDVLEGSTEAVNSSAAAALAAQEAAENAASAASGGGIGIDPDDADTLILSTRDDGTVITDPSDSDALLITI